MTMRRSGLPTLVKALLAGAALPLLPFANAQDLSPLLLVAENRGLDFSYLTSVSDGPLVLGTEAAGPFTLLAPTNFAFHSFPEKYFTPDWREYLKALLEYHVLVGEFSSTDIQVSKELLTLFPGDSVTVTAEDPVTFNGHASVVETDVEASNGILHTIDKVMVPPKADLSLLDHITASPEFSIFLEYLTRFNLTSILEEEGPMTVVIPTNSAFQSMPSFVLEQFDDAALAQLLLHHIIPTIAFAYPLNDDKSNAHSYPTMQGSGMVLFSGGVADRAEFAGLGKDVLANNGIWHSIDTVLTPIVSADGLSTPPDNDDTTTVMDVLTSTPELGWLTNMLRDGGLLSTLGLEGPFTLLAPVNTAFFKSPISVILRSLSDQARLEVLKYHVIPALVRSEDMVTGATFKTLQGSMVTVTNDTPLTVNDAALVQADILASNGIIHYIDTVQFPVIISTPATKTPTPMTTPNPKVVPTVSPSMDPNSNEATPTLAPSENTSPIDTAEPTSGVSAPLRTVIEVVVDTEELSSLETALFNTAVEATLLKEGPFTLFAPTNTAFSFGGVLEGLLNRQQILVMTYHVVPGIYMSDDLIPGMELRTLEGQVLTISDTGMINGATILSPNLLATNGVVHVIDTLLKPPSVFGTPQPTDQPSLLSPTMSPVLPPVWELIASDSRYGMFAKLLADSGVIDTLDTDGQLVTIFAPTDDALGRLPSYLLKEIVGESLVKLVSDHVVTGVYDAASLVNGVTLETLEGATIRVSLDDSQALPTLLDESGNLAGIVYVDDEGSNGIVHGINKLLISNSQTNAPSASPAVSTTRAPKVETEVPTAFPTVAEASTCDEEMASYARVCCPLEEVENPGYRAFCESLFNRNAASASPVTGTTRAPATTTTAPETKPPTTSPPTVPAQQAEPTDPPTTTTAAETVPPTATPPTTTGEQPMCDDEVAAFAKVCCPVENPAYESFCEILFNRHNAPKDTIVWSWQDGKLVGSSSSATTTPISSSP